MDFSALYTIVILAFGPGLFWLIYIYQKDRLEPEPKRLVLSVFFLGLLSVLPASALGFLIHFYWPKEIPFLVHTCFLTPILEELTKFSVVYFAIFHHREFNEPMDGIVYASAAALGFASLENIFFLGFEYYYPTPEFVDAPVNGLWKLALFRGLLSVPGHIVDSSMWGLAMGLAKFLSDKTIAHVLIVKGLIWGMILHGLFNYLAANGLSVFILLAVQIALLWYLNRKVRVALRYSPFAYASNK